MKNIFFSIHCKDMAKLKTCFPIKVSLCGSQINGVVFVDRDRCYIIEFINLGSLVSGSGLGILYVLPKIDSFLCCPRPTEE